MRDPFKNKITFSWIQKNLLPRNPVQESGITRISDWTSKPQRKPSRATTSIKNVPSPATSPFEARSWRVSSSPPKCREQSLWEEIISTMSPNTIDMKRDIETSQPIAPQLSQSKKEISSSSENADLSQKPSISTCWRWPPTKSSVT